MIGYDVYSIRFGQDLFNRIFKYDFCRSRFGTSQGSD